MFTEEDFPAISKFLKLGVRITIINPVGQHPVFATSFPNPKGGMVDIKVTTIYDVERKLRTLLANDTPVRTKLTPFTYLGTNFEGLIYCTKGTNEFVLQETRDMFGVESKKIVRSAEHFIQLLQ